MHGMLLDTTCAWVPEDHLDRDALAIGYKAALEKRRSTVVQEAVQAVKVEEKPSVVLGGYMACTDELGKRLGMAAVAIPEMAIEHKSFAQLQVTELANANNQHICT